MRLSARMLLLKLMAVTSIAVYIYTGVLALRTVLFGTDGNLNGILVFIFVILFGSAAGWLFTGENPVLKQKPFKTKALKFMAFMLNIKNLSKLLLSAIAWILIAIPLLTVFLIYRDCGLLRMAFELVLIMIAYCTSLKYSQMAYTHIFSKRAVYTGFAVLAGSMELIHFFSDLSYLKPWFLAASYYLVLVYLILRNQQDIDDNIFHSKHVEKFVLPKNLRRFNTAAVIVIFLSILLFFNLQPVIMYLFELLGKAAKAVIAAIIWLLNHIFPASPDTGNDPAGTPQDPGIMDEPINLIHPLRNFITNILIKFVLFYIAYRVLMITARRLPVLLRIIGAWLRKLFAVNGSDKLPEIEDYVDETETVKPARLPEQKKIIKKNLKKSKKDLRKITDPAERVRYMYASILNLLPLIGILPEKSDTTLEILKKTEISASVKREVSPFTSTYNKVRYGGTAPEPHTLAEAEKNFNNIVEIIDRIK